MVFSSWSSLPWRMRFEAAGVLTRISSAATRPLLVGPLQQLLRDDAAQRGREHRADVRLLVGRKDVDHAIHRLGRRRWYAACP